MKCDVFISYKHTDDGGNVTPDHAIAEKLYNALVSLGYAAFFSANSLEKIGSSRYKADIDEALDSAKVMVVVVCQVEYATSHWVQYEWDSFYNDYLSGVRKEANLFTLTKDINIHDLPRTLRNVQNFDYAAGIERVCDYIKNVIPAKQEVEKADTEKKKERFSIITGNDITEEYIKQVLDIEDDIYNEDIRVTVERCVELHRINPDIYIMIKDNDTQKIVGCMDIEPIDDDFYEKMKTGVFRDMEITTDVLLDYNMPYPYSVYFSSVIIHPDYRNTEVFFELYNMVIDKFLNLSKREIYIRRMIADAVTRDGEKFCKLFGMKKVKVSDHNSFLYEITMIPPKFKTLSQKTKALFDCYKKKYEESPWLFTDDDTL